jgi:hypothetical protein
MLLEIASLRVQQIQQEPLRFQWQGLQRFLRQADLQGQQFQERELPMEFPRRERRQVVQPGLLQGQAGLPEPGQRQVFRPVQLVPQRGRQQGRPVEQRQRRLTQWSRPRSSSDSFSISLCYFFFAIYLKSNKKASIFFKKPSFLQKM